MEDIDQYVLENEAEIYGFSSAFPQIDCNGGNLGFNNPGVLYPADSSRSNGSSSSEGTLNNLNLSIANSIDVQNMQPGDPELGPLFQNVGYLQNDSSNSGGEQGGMSAMREMIFRVAAMQPIHIDPESIKRPKRRNVRISKDPQSVAARHRRERISERIRILQRLVPGGTKMDTASMLDEAIHYVKFLKNQVQALEAAATTSPSPSNPKLMWNNSLASATLPAAFSASAYSPFNSLHNPSVNSNLSNCTLPFSALPCNTFLPNDRPPQNGLI